MGDRGRDAPVRERGGGRKKGGRQDAEGDRGEVQKVRKLNGGV